MIEYRSTTDNLSARQLNGFFVGWPNPPSPDTHLRILQSSSHIVVAIDDETGQVVGFVTAITDRVLCAYIPLLEVLPDYQHRGIGSELMGRMQSKLEHLYMVDLLCMEDLRPFYERFGFASAHAMANRRFERQHGLPAENS